MNTTTAQVYLSPEKKQEALQTAQELFTKLPDWLTFFKATLGIDGNSDVDVFLVDNLLIDFVDAGVDRWIGLQRHRNRFD